MTMDSQVTRGGEALESGRFLALAHQDLQGELVADVFYRATGATAFARLTRADLTALKDIATALLEQGGRNGR